MRKLIALFLIVVITISAAGCTSSLSKKTAVKENNDAVKAAQNVAEKLEPGCEATSYDMNVTLDTKSNTVSGYEDITVKNNSGASLDRICLRYFAESVESKSEIVSVKDADTQKEYSVSVESDASCVYVTMQDEKFEDGAVKKLRVEFSTVIPKKDDRFGYHEEEFGKMYLLTFWAPQLAMYENGEWNKSPYIADGESTYNAMSNYTVHLTAPEDYVIAASGTQTKNGTETVISAPNVREMAIVACNYVTVQTETVDDITVNMYRPSYEEYNTLYDIIFANAKEALSFYSSTVGEYIYDELDVVPAFIAASGMEMPGLVIEALPVDENGKKCEVGEYTYISAAHTVAHEIAHQWFYCAIGNDQYNEPWLDEAFADYYASYAYWNTSNEALEMTFKAAAALNTEESYDSLVSSYKTEYQQKGDLFDGIHYINLPCNLYDAAGYSSYVYSLGAAFLRDLRSKMGDSFDEMMKNWYAENKNGIVHGSDFINEVLKYSSTDEVKTVINTYLSDEYIR